MVIASMYPGMALLSTITSGLFASTEMTLPVIAYCLVGRNFEQPTQQATVSSSIAHGQETRFRETGTDGKDRLENILFNYRGKTEMGSGCAFSAFFPRKRQAPKNA